MKLYRELYGIQTTCLRYFNAYSEDQPYGGAYTTAISAWMEMIRQGKPLRIDGDGEQTRDFVHVEDIVSANILAMERDDMDAEYYNVGYGEAFSMNFVKDFIDSIHDVEWDHAPARKGDARHTLADISALKEKVGVLRYLYKKVLKDVFPKKIYRIMNEIIFKDFKRYCLRKYRHLPNKFTIQICSNNDSR